MLTPISTARMATGPLGATNGTNTSVAGRLLTRLASRAATAAITSNAGSVEPSAPDGSTVDIARPMPLSVIACTMTPSASTNTKNDAFTERAISITPFTSGVCRRRRLRTASTEAPASATQAGATPTDSETANPASVSATTSKTNTGGLGPGGGRRRSRAKNTRKTPYTAATAASHGNAITSVNLANESFATWKASRLVRF